MLLTEGLDCPSTCPHVFPGRGLGSGPIPGGCRLGPEELLLGGGRAHAACLPHAHDPLPTYREPQEECQGWDSSLKLACPIPSLDQPSLCSTLPSQRLQGLTLSPLLSAGMYSCPCYYYPNRAGSSDRASFVIGIDLRSGTMPSDHWIKRGTALLMILDS